MILVKTPALEQTPFELTLLTYPLHSHALTTFSLPTTSTTSTNTTADAMRAEPSEPEQRMPAAPPTSPAPSNNHRDIEDPLHPETKAKFKAKSSSQYFDPCQEAANRSIRCLNRNAGDREMCLDYFQAYRDCKKRWIEDMKEEKRRKTRMSLF